VLIEEIGEGATQVGPLHLPEKIRRGGRALARRPDAGCGTRRAVGTAICLAAMRERRRAGSSMGGTGLEPVTPSLSSRYGDSRPVTGTHVCSR
jgi:hypothetical protein